MLLVINENFVRQLEEVNIQDALNFLDFEKNHGRKAIFIKANFGEMKDLKNILDLYYYL